MRCRSCDTVWLVGGDAEAGAYDAYDANDDHGGGEDVERPSLRHAAVVRRGTERERRDLFASRPSDDGGVSPTIPPPSAAVAARNESSVLFTVDSLRGSEQARTPEPEPPSLPTRPLVDDDEGVIDLKALASATAKPAARHVAPLFTSEPPPAAFARDASASDGYATTEERRFPLKLKKIGVGVAAAVGAVLVVVGIASAFKGEEPVERTAAAQPPPPVVTPPPPAAPDPDPAAAAASPDDSKAPAVGVSGKKGKKASSGGGKSAVIVFKKGQASGGAAPAPPPPVKAADPCGCHGDFSCILRCTAKGK